MVESKTSEEVASEEEAAEKEEQNYKVEYESPCCVVITVEADAESLKKEYEEQFKTYQQNAQLPGFRPGKAPRIMVERKFGDSIKEQILYMTVMELFNDAVEKEDITVVNELETPDFENFGWEPGEPATVEFKCEIIPSIDVDEELYKGIKIQAPVDDVPDDMFESALEQFAQQYSDWEKLGDDAVIDQNDSVVAQIKLISPEIEKEFGLDELSFIPGTDELGPFLAEGLNGAVVGAKKGDTIEIEASVKDEIDDEFDDPALEELAEAEKVVLELDIQDVYRYKTPEIDEEFAENMGLDNLEELHDIVRNQVQQDMDSQRHNFMRGELIKKLGELIDFELPDSIVENAAEDLRRRESLRLWREEGKELEEAQNEVADDPSYKENAIQSLRAEFVINKIAEKERIFASETDLNEQIRAFAASRGIDEHKARRTLEKRDLLDTWRRDLKREKVIQMLLENADVEEVKWDELGGGEEEETEVAEDVQESEEKEADGE